MRALVVYESMFGNTQEVARAVAAGLAPYGDVELVEVAGAPAAVAEDVGLLVVGGPTHAFGMSRPRTRQDAAAQAGARAVSTGIGLREWLGTVRGVGAGLAAAAFDTRIDRPRVPGSAARRAHRRLRRLGARTAAEPESFYVSASAGPLVPGEAERARRWAQQLAVQAVQGAGQR